MIGAWVIVGPGVYEPVFSTSAAENEIPIAAFALDRVPVTNGDFLTFVQSQPAWRRDRIAAVHADAAYLTHWAAADDLGAAGRNEPVTQVSWFAARAYCASRRARLPTEAEWEFAAAADESRVDARRDPTFVRRLLDWYAVPTPEHHRDVGVGPPNVWGVQDLHGLVWEWVEDFNATLVSSDNREQGNDDRSLFCGSGAVASSDPSDYAAFQRFAFRSSLRGSYTTANLGFRCAGDPS